MAITTLKTELAWSMAKQAESEYYKSSKEMLQHQHKIEKAKDEIQNEIAVQENLKKEKTIIEHEIHSLAKEADEFENVLNGYTENAKLAKEGITKYVANARDISQRHLYHPSHHNPRSCQH